MNRSKRQPMLWDGVEIDPFAPTLEEFERLIGVSDAASRRLALKMMRDRIEAGDPPGRYLDLARRMLDDGDETCRWQALIVVSESIAVDPESAWDLILERGPSADDDLRAGLAAVLLARLFRIFPERYEWSVLRMVAEGTGWLVDLAEYCPGAEDLLATAECP